MRLIELAEEYDRSYRLLLGRIKELQAQLKGYAPPEEQAELETRIRDLETLARDMREMRNICRDYYTKGVYLDDRLTTRYLAVRPRGISRVPSARQCRQRRPAKPAEAKPATRDSGGPDAEAARNAADAIFAELFGAANQQRVRGRTVNRIPNTGSGKAEN
jgi:hypothetical protein